MGAEGSKSSSNASSKHVWLTGEEKQILHAHVKELMANSQSISMQKFEANVASRVGEELSNNFSRLLTGWRTKASNKATAATSPDTTFSPEQLTALLMEILNPDCTVQAEVMMLLAGGTGGSVSAEPLLQAVSAVVGCYCNASSQQNALPDGRVARDDGASGRLALAWLHHLVYGGASHKQTAGQPVPAAALSQAAVERWLLSHSSLYLVVQCAALRELAAPKLPPIEPRLLPAITVPSGVHLRLSAAEVLLLNSALPPLLRCEWRLLFSNQIHGDSFTLLMKHIVGCGPSLLLLEAEDGSKFGGFASGSWEVRPQFHGTAECFLFSLMPSAGIYNTTGYNTNYQYLNYLHNNTMPNGLGMGGREELFGLFLSADDFGLCRVAPTCTTFQSPPLCSSDSPRVRYLTVWAVGEEVQDSDDEEDAPRQRSALDRNPDARAMLDMIGKTRISEGLREPDPVPEDC